MSETPSDPQQQPEPERSPVIGDDDGFYSGASRRQGLADERATDRASVVSRQREEYGGIKPFVAFLGWLCSTGMLVLLTAVAAAIGAGIGSVTTSTRIEELAAQRGVDTGGITWVGVVVLLVVVLLAYYTGGYVAGRMARFDGLRQGLAVWLWAVLIAVVVGVLGVTLGDRYNVLDGINTFPRLPSSVGDLTTQGLVALIGVIVLSLVGALLGGLAGMHFHRKVDKAGLGV